MVVNLAADCFVQKYIMEHVLSHTSLLYYETGPDVSEYKNTNGLHIGLHIQNYQL